MSPRPDVSEARKEQILAAALAVFSRLGLAQARMDDIVAEAGLSKGAIYWYFTGKDEIIAAILESIRSQGKLDEAREARVMAADSKARYYDANIKANYPSVRVRPRVKQD